MPPVDGSGPERAAGATEARYSLAEFARECPDDAACLDLLWRERYASGGHRTACPKCRRERKFHRVRSRPAYSCDSCGHSLYPLAGTIFNKSSTPLQLWFYAIYIMASTRCEVSVKHLQRELGVTYKTAWRMFNLIRNKLTTDEKRPFPASVRIDEAPLTATPSA
jgi:transposase